GAELLRLAHARLDPGAEPPEGAAVPDLTAHGPEGRTARTALALREATRAGGWTLLDHPMLALDVAGSLAFLEPDAVVVHPPASWPGRPGSRRWPGPCPRARASRPTGVPRS